MYSFNKEILDQALSQEQFVAYAQEMISTSNKIEPYTQQAYVDYTKVNIDRMQKIIRNFQLDKKLYNLLSEGVNDWTWVLISEPWCGDGSFIQPVLYAMSVAGAGNIDFKILLRDQHTDVMNEYLTNGGMAIPKMVCLDKNLNELGTWGPRPQALQTEFTEWKKEEGFDFNTKIKKLNRWYIKDKGVHLQNEMINLVKEWKTKQQ